MRKILIIFIFILSSYKMYAPNIEEETNKDLMILYNNLIKEEKAIEYNENELNKFLESIAVYESGSNYKRWNKWGYIGKYQFGISTRRATGFGYVNFYQFIKYPDIWSEGEQDMAMIILLKKNQLTLQDVIDRNEGKLINGREITKSGILAAAHIAGAGGVRRYFRTNTNYNPKDPFGTSLETYLLYFSGYDFNFEFSEYELNN